jgi:hypothetical protein
MYLLVQSCANAVVHGCKLYSTIPIPRPTIMPPAVRTKKGPNFSAEEDVCLTRAWAKATLDSAVGNNQKSSMFWDKVFAFFKEMYTAATSKAVPEERNLVSITNRWKRHISSECRIMDSIMKHNPRGTGQNDQTYAATLAAIFKAQEKKTFRFAACFEHLKDVPTFTMGSGQAAILELPQELQELFDAAAANNNPAVANNPAVVNPHVEEGTAVDTVNLRLERPMGVKQAKKRIQTMKRIDTENKRRRNDMTDASAQMKSLGIVLDKTSKREILLKLAEKYEQRGDEEKASKYFKKLEDLLSESESEDEEVAVSSDGSDIGNGPLNGQVVDLANDDNGSSDNSITN